MTTDTTKPGIVRLSFDNWMGILGIVVLLVGAGWKFTVDMSVQMARLEQRDNEIQRRLDRIEQSLERNEVASGRERDQRKGGGG